MGLWEREMDEMDREYQYQIAYEEAVNRIAELEADKEQHLRVIESLKEDVARLLQVNAKLEKYIEELRFNRPL